MKTRFDSATLSLSLFAVFCVLAYLSPLFRHGFTSAVIDFDVSTAALFGVIFLPMFSYLRRIKKISWAKMLFVAIFYAYVVGLISYTLFPIFLQDDTTRTFGQNVWGNMNLIPLFRLKSSEMKSMFLNILLFIPFGYGLPFLKRTGGRSVILSGFCVSICIETLQLLTALAIGFSLRRVDVNDVIFNTLGAFLGYCTFLVFARLFQAVLLHGKLERNPILDHIDKMTKR